MGSYNTAVITTVGQALLTSVLGAQGTMTFTKLQTSSYAYASGTDLSALTSLNNVEQEVSVTAGVIDSTHIYANALISNTGVSTEYSVNTLGIFVSDGNSEVLFAVSTAETPDVIPVDSGGTPSTYKYKFNLAVSSTSDITITGSGEIDAADVDYTNTASGLSATTVQGAIDELAASLSSGGNARQADLSSIIATGSTNTTGAQIKAGTYFYLNDTYCKAKTNIASNATFTLNTNYEVVTVGNALENLGAAEYVELGTPVSIPVMYKVIYTGFWTSTLYTYLHIRLEGDVYNSLINPLNVTVKFISADHSSYDIMWAWNYSLYLTSTVTDAKSRVSSKLTSGNPNVLDVYIKYADQPETMGSVVLQFFFNEDVRLTLLEGLTTVPSGLSAPNKATIISSTTS